MGRKELIVVGGGIAGAAAALRAAQYHLNTTWVQGDRKTHKSSRTAYVMNVDNMVGVHPGIMRDKILDALDPGDESARRVIEDAHFHISTADIVDNVCRRIEKDFADWVRMLPEKATEASRSDGAFRVVAGGETLEAPYLVLATGVMDRQPVIHKQKGGRDLSGIHWLFPYANHETLLYCVRCEGHLTAGRRVAIIGAGSGAAEVALMVRERYDSEVVVLTAGDPIAWDATRGRLLELEGVTIHEGRLTDIHGGDRGAALGAFTVEGHGRVDVDLAFVVMGLHRVYNGLARDLGAALEDSTEPPERRHVIVHGNAETTVPDLFAVGDMTRHPDGPVMKQVYTAQEYAVRAVDAIDRRRRRARRDALLQPPTDH